MCVCVCGSRFQYAYMSLRLFSHGPRDQEAGIDSCHLPQKLVPAGTEKQLVHDVCFGSSCQKRNEGVTAELKQTSRNLLVAHCEALEGPLFLRFPE